MRFVHGHASRMRTLEHERRGERCCKRCSATQPLEQFRRMSNGVIDTYCDSCRKAYAREHYQRNRAERLAAQVTYEAAHRSEAAARKRAWVKRNPKRARELARADERRRLVGRNPTAVEYQGILRRDPCAYCGGAADVIDHIHALSRDGTNDWDNLTAACRSCNSSKRDRPLLRFLAAR